MILAEKIREDLEKKFEVFPGQIKITIIREFRTETTTKIKQLKNRRWV
jgi:ribonuclease Y